VKFDNVMLLLTDAASYIKKTAGLTRATCVAHALHSVCKTIRVLYSDRGQSVANGEKIFVKSLVRTDLFKDNAPDPPPPPTLAITRWVTWLDVTVYYTDNFDIFSSAVHELDRDDSSPTARLQLIFNDSN
jgi:hypothetical protein